MAVRYTCDMPHFPSTSIYSPIQINTDQSYNQVISAPKGGFTMSDDEVRAPKEEPMTIAPNKFSCTPGALNENTAVSVRIEGRRVHGRE